MIINMVSLFLQRNRRNGLFVEVWVSFRRFYALLTRIFFIYCNLKINIKPSRLTIPFCTENLVTEIFPIVLCMK